MFDSFKDTIEFVENYRKFYTVAKAYEATMKQIEAEQIVKMVENIKNNNQTNIDLVLKLLSSR